MTNLTPANDVIDRQSEMNKLPEIESIDYDKAWCRAWQVSGTVNWSGTTLITFDMEDTVVIFDVNSVV